ncbi:hypothetical protein ACFXHA_40925 [Nocardia sp. NPDC059240]|uniref:hypothetical protein n=1 Tax=Nocardia sp. NPDC059240 TaxID=3346786 RepID=UPI003698AC3F
MQSLGSELEHPAVDRFLSAVDEVMNSNTLLLKIRTDSPITDEHEGAAVLEFFLRSAVFCSAMLEADLNRDWWNLQWMADSAAADKSRLLREGFELTCSPMSASEFETRLIWMLCTAFSPYGRHRTAGQARELIRDFERQLFGPSPADWSFVAVQPNFLASTHYYDRQDGGSSPAYFDGGPNDSASFVFRGDIFYFLLTNGSP